VNVGTAEIVSVTADASGLGDGEGSAELVSRPIADESTTVATAMDAIFGEANSS
jgi:hypothetical protein